MAKMWELLTIDQLAEMIPDVRAGLDLIREGREATPAGKRFNVTAALNDADLGEPLLMYVHARMLQKSRPPPPDFPLPPKPEARLFQGSISSLVNEISEGSLTKAERSTLMKAIYRQLSQRGLTLNTGFRYAWWVVPQAEYVGHSDGRGPAPKDRKLDGIVEQQLERNPEQPVKTIYTIPELPDQPTPDDLIAWAKSTITAFNNLAHAYEQQEQTVVDLTVELGLAKDAGWSSAGEVISGLISDG